MGSLTKLFEDGRVLSMLRSRLDGWENVLTGLGTVARDAVQSAVFKPDAILDDITLENMYHHDDLSRRVVTELPQAALRKGFSLVRKSDGDQIEEASPEEVARLQAALKRWKVAPKLLEARIWGRLYGRGALFLVFSGSDPSLPISLDGAPKLLDIIVLEKRDFVVSEYDPNTLEPLIWQLHVGDNPNVASVQIHNSRLVLFWGEQTSRRERLRNGWADHSVLQSAYKALRSYNTAWDAIDHRMKDFSQGVFKMKGLFDLIANGDVGLIRDRMQTVDMGRSIARALILDAEDEDFTYQESGAFAGVADILDRREGRLASATRYPKSVLFGESQSGMSDDGTDNARNWVQQIEIEQEELREPLELLINLVARSEGLQEGWSVSFPSPWTYTPKEIADHKIKVSTVDKVYVDMGVLLAEEVAATRFGSKDGFFVEPEIDLELRQKLLDVAKEKLEKEAEEPPPDDLQQSLPFGEEPDEESEEPDDESEEPDEEPRRRRRSS